MDRLTLKDINDIIRCEDECGVQNLIQEIFAHPNAEKGLDVIEDEHGNYEVVSGTTLKITVSTKIDKGD
jgi:hypothetical protein